MIITQGRDTRSRLFAATYTSVLHLPLMSIQLFVPTLKTSRVRVLSTTILSLHHTQHYSICKSISSSWDNSTCITWIMSKCIRIFFHAAYNWSEVPPCKWLFIDTVNYIDMSLTWFDDGEKRYNRVEIR